jgi:hypothetical protein
MQQGEVIGRMGKMRGLVLVKGNVRIEVSDAGEL